MKNRHRHGEQQQARSGGHADHGALPDGRRGGQPVHRAAAGDQAGPEKPNARDDLGRDAGRVEHDGAGVDYVTKSVFADDQDDRCGCPHDRLRAEAGALALSLTLQADQRGEAKRGQQLDEVTRALAIAVEERGIGGVLGKS